MNMCVHTQAAFIVLRTNWSHKRARKKNCHVITFSCCDFPWLFSSPIAAAPFLALTQPIYEQTALQRQQIRQNTALLSMTFVHNYQNASTDMCKWLLIWCPFSARSLTIKSVLYDRFKFVSIHHVVIHHHYLWSVFN